MLCLSRKINEVVRVGDGISIMILSIRGDKVRLGIVAPAAMRVDRQEVREAIEREIARRELPGPIPGEWRESEE